MRFVMISEQYTTYACHYTVRTHQIVLQKPDDQAHGKTFFLFFYCWKQGACLGVRRTKQLSKLGCQTLHDQKLHE